MPKLKVTLGIGFAGARHEDEIEIDEDEWNDCETEEEREKLIDEYATEWAWDYIDIGANLLDEDI